MFQNHAAINAQGLKRSHVQPVALWSFDNENGKDQISGKIDEIKGYTIFAKGVSGKALHSDEFGTSIIRNVENTPTLDSKEFSVEAWIAPQTFPWNFCPIVSLRNEQQTFYFGINYQGQLQLHAMVAGNWVLCESPKALPGLHEYLKFAGEGGKEENTANFGEAMPNPSLELLKWNHVAGSLDKDGILRLFINGETVAEIKANLNTPEIKIQSASYQKIIDKNDVVRKLETVDITEHIQKLVNHGQLDIVCNNTDLGIKYERLELNLNFQIEYSLNGKLIKKELKQSEGIDLTTGKVEHKALEDWNETSTFPATQGISIARSTKAMRPLFLARNWVEANKAKYCSLDGLLDEIKIYDTALSAKEVKQAYKSIQPKVAQPLQHRRMPTAQDMPGDFGAFYTNFKYDEHWDRTRRFSEHQDLFVRFKDNPCTFVAWNGTVYPIFYPDGGNVGQQFEAQERWTKISGCHEAMMDRQSRHSTFRIIENTPARVVIHWRHALAARDYTIMNPNGENEWGDWVDDYYTIYPDVVCARATKLWTSDPMGGNSYAQDNSVIQPGLMPWDVYEKEPLSIANIDGQETIETMGQGHHGPKDPDFKGPAVIQRHNFNTQWKPFMISPPNISFGGAWTNDQPWPWFLPCWHHWPTAQLIDSDGSITFVENGRPKSSSISNGWNSRSHKPELCRLTRNSKTQFSLIGMTDQSAGSLAPLARSYRQAAKATTESAGFKSEGYVLDEKAYHFSRTDNSAVSNLKIKVAASKDSPLVNPAIVVKDWGDKIPAIICNGEKLKSDSDYKIGFHKTVRGTNLILWIKRVNSDTVQIEINTAK